MKKLGTHTVRYIKYGSKRRRVAHALLIASFQGSTSSGLLLGTFVYICMGAEMSGRRSHECRRRELQDLLLLMACMHTHTDERVFVLDQVRGNFNTERVNLTLYSFLVKHQFVI